MCKLFLSPCTVSIINAVSAMYNSSLSAMKYRHACVCVYMCVYMYVYMFV